MDKVTAELLLSAVKNGASSDSVASLYGELSRNQGGPTPEAERWFADNQNKRVKIKHTSYVGIVTELNESRSGIYNGGRYPIYVKILEATNGAVGKTFEYGIEQLEVLE